jgi:hypothetical protein
MDDKCSIFWKKKRRKIIYIYIYHMNSWLSEWMYLLWGQKLNPYIACALLCWTVIINWTRPLVVVRTVLRIHNHGSQEGKNQFPICNHGSQKLKTTRWNYPDVVSGAFMTTTGYCRVVGNQKEPAVLCFWFPFISILF